MPKYQLLEFNKARDIIKRTDVIPDKNSIDWVGDLYKNYKMAPDGYGLLLIKIDGEKRFNLECRYR